MDAEIIKRSKARQNCDDLGNEIIKLMEERYKLQLDDANKVGMKEKIAELHRFHVGLTCSRPWRGIILRDSILHYRCVLIVTVTYVCMKRIITGR